MKVAQQLIISNEMLEEDSFNIFNTGQNFYLYLTAQGKVALNIFQILQLGSNHLLRQELGNGSQLPRLSECLRVRLDCAEAIHRGSLPARARCPSLAPCRFYRNTWEYRDDWIRQERETGSYESSFVFGMALNDFEVRTFKQAKKVMEKAIRIAQFLDV